MAALIFILISLTAAVFHGAAPVRAEDATTPTPVVIDGTTADVTVELFTDEGRKTPLDDNAVLSTNTLYGSFSAKFEANHGPSAERNVAEYSLPDSIKAFDNTGGRLMDDSNQEAGTWRCENNKLIFTFKESWIKTHPSDVHVGADFSFKLANENVGSGNTTKVKFPGTAEIDIATIDGDVAGEKEGKFSQSGAEGKVTWTLKLVVESYAHNVQLTDELGSNFTFVPESFKLNGETLKSQLSINEQTAILNLGNLSQGTYTITYDSMMNPNVSVSDKEWINRLDGSKNNAFWTWSGNRSGKLKEPVLAEDFRYDMIGKSHSLDSTPSDIEWTVKLNQGELKADMSGYVFTDTLDDKQTYAGNYTVYKGSSGSTVLATGELDQSKKSFTYKFSDNLEDKYITYRIVYHTKMNETGSYDTVRNSATIEHDGSVSGTGKGEFTPQLVDTPITKELVGRENAATTGEAKWKTRVALKAIVNAANLDKVTVKDTFQSAWKQDIGVDVNSIKIKIGKTELVRGDDWKLTTNELKDGNNVVQKDGHKRNFNLDININDKVKAALANEDYADITYTTTSDALPGWYSNFASVTVPGQNGGWPYYTDSPMYVVNKETTPAVEKPKAEAKVTWNEDFDWSAVDGSNEKGAWVVDWTVYANRQKTAAGDCYGAGKLGRVPLNIIDTIPDGMSYVAGSAKYTIVQNPYDLHAGLGRGGEAKEVVTDQKLAADNVSSNGNTVTFSIPTTDLGDYAGYAKLTYKTAVKRGELDTSTNEVKFTNKASAGSGVKKFDSGKGDVTIKNNVIKKSGEQVANSNCIKYTIFVNESAVALKNGTDFLELVDTMDAKCTLVPSTLKVYERVNGGWVALSQKDYSSKMEQVSDKTGVRTKLTLNVPDKKYLKVEYEVIPIGNPGEEVPLSNTAELTGVTEGSAIDEQKWKIQNASASAGGNGYGITMTKYDAQQVGATLEHARFTLYSVNMDQVATVGIENARTEFETAPTDANGKISFGAEDKAMVNCVLYQLVETKAPDGYDAAAPTWIMLKGNADDEKYQTELNKAKSIVKDSEIIGDDKKDEIWIYDNRLMGSVDIKAQKVLEGGTFKAGQFSFELKDDKGRVLKTVTNGADGSISFSVECNKAGTYTYTISEVVPKDAVNGVKDHITYDGAVYNGKVEVTNGKKQLDTKVTYAPADPTTPPTFTNKYSTTLPEAGGAGLTMTYLAGASLLCFAATWMHARRHRDLDRGDRHE